MEKTITASSSILKIRQSANGLVATVDVNFALPDVKAPVTGAFDEQSLSAHINFLGRDADRRLYVDVPAEGYVISFFAREYGDGRSSIEAAMNGTFGGLLKMMVEKQPYRQCLIRRKLPGKKLRIFLPQRFNRAFVREEVLMALGEYLDSFFRQKFIAFVDGAASTGSSDTNAVNVFLDKYQISTDDWCSDTARKCYRDWQKGKEKRNGFVL